MTVSKQHVSTQTRHWRRKNGATTGRRSESGASFWVAAFPLMGDLVSRDPSRALRMYRHRERDRCKARHIHDQGAIGAPLRVEVSSYPNSAKVLAAARTRTSTSRALASA